MRFKFWKSRNKAPNIREIICPPAYKPTEQEHQLAYHKYMMDYIIYEVLYGIQLDREGFPGGMGKPKVDYVKELDKFLDLIFVNNVDVHKSPLEVIYPYKGFKKQQLENMSDIHRGDCVACPCSCVRCHTEDLYGIDSVTWKGKHKGWKLYNQYLEEIKNEKSTTKT